MSQESTGIHWLLSDTNFILSSIEKRIEKKKGKMKEEWRRIPQGAEASVSIAVMPVLSSGIRS